MSRVPHRNPVIRRAISSEHLGHGAFVRAGHDSAAVRRVLLLAARQLFGQAPGVMADHAGRRVADVGQRDGAGIGQVTNHDGAGDTQLVASIIPEIVVRIMAGLAGQWTDSKICGGNTDLADVNLRGGGIGARRDQAINLLRNVGEPIGRVAASAAGIRPLGCAEIIIAAGVRAILPLRDTVITGPVLVASGTDLNIQTLRWRAASQRPAGLVDTGAVATFALNAGEFLQLRRHPIKVAHLHLGRKLPAESVRHGFEIPVAGSRGRLVEAESMTLDAALVVGTRPPVDSPLHHSRMAGCRPRTPHVLVAELVIRPVTAVARIRASRRILCRSACNGFGWRGAAVGEGIIAHDIGPELREAICTMCQTGRGAVRFRRQCPVGAQIAGVDTERNSRCARRLGGTRNGECPGGRFFTSGHLDFIDIRGVRNRFVIKTNEAGLSSRVHEFL